jgi:hypothetical protein
MKSESSDKAVCDLCGRGAAQLKPHILFSRVIPRSEQRVSPQPAETSVLGSETGFRRHDLLVCGRCHGRKWIYLFASLAMLAGWIWLAVESRGCGPPLAGFAALLAVLFAGSPFLPIQRLARRVRREEKEAFAAAHPGLRFYVKTVTPGALGFHQETPPARMMVKRCKACQREVPVSSKVGDCCPHCGVRWGSEMARCGSCGKQVDGPMNRGQACPLCGAAWDA